MDKKKPFNNLNSRENKEEYNPPAKPVITNILLADQNKEDAKQVNEFAISNEELSFRNSANEKRAQELIIADKALAYHIRENQKSSRELTTANKQLHFQNAEKEKRAAELVIANKELAFQSSEKEARARELTIANKELHFQNDEKEKRAAELIIANRELAFQSSEKEDRARELTIANKELHFQNREKEKMVAEIVQRNKDLEQFSYIISHNLRAPVANIIGLTEELADATHTHEVKDQFIKDLSSSARLLDDLIIDLNTILQVKREVNERKQKVILSQLVNNIKSSIHNLIRIEKVKIITNFTQANEFVTLSSYLHSIFYNLIINSIKYHQPGLPAVIEIKSEKSGNQLMLTFKDNGSGIDLTKKGDQIFGLYKRFHHNIEGKGMGLFMVKAQVDALGGNISIESRPNEGAKFIITFNM